MDAAQGLKFEKDWGSAGTDSERLDVLAEQAKAQILCSLSTKMHIKGLETELANGLKAIHKQINDLHACPRFRKDPLGWLRFNWQWLVIFLLVVKQLELVELLAGVFRIGG